MPTYSAGSVGADAHAFRGGSGRVVRPRYRCLDPARRGVQDGDVGNAGAVAAGVDVPPSESTARSLTLSASGYVATTAFVDMSMTWIES